MDAFSIIAGGSIAIVASCIGAMIAHIFSESRSSRKEFNQAAANFRADFIQELRYLDYRYSPNRRDAPGIHKTLTTAYNRHEIAVIKFRYFLNFQEGVGFDKAWNDYCDKKNGKPRFMVYSEPDKLIDKTKTQKFYLFHLEKLLTFANFK